MTVARGWRRLAILAIACVAVACTSGPPPPNDAPYVGQIEQDRAEKDAFFKTTDGPLTPEQRRTFTSLPYFPVDPAYRVPARLVIETVDRATVLELPPRLRTGTGPLIHSTIGERSEQ